MKISAKSYHLLAILMIYVLCFAAYSNAFHHQFLIDDHGIVLKDVHLHQLKYWIYQFIPDFEKSLGMADAERNVYYRPFAHLLPMVCYVLFHQNAAGYHLFNFILFTSTSVVVYFFLFSLFKDKGLALLTSLFFCIHPLNGLMVNYKTASVFSLQIMAVLLAILASRRSFIKTRTSLFYFVFSLLLFIVALMCHETSMFFPFYLMAVLYFVDKCPGKETFIKCAPYGILLVIFFIFRMQYASLKINLFDKFHFMDLSVFGYSATLTKLIVWHLSRFFTLNDIVLTWRIPPVSEHVVEWNVLLAALVAAAVGIILLRKRAPEKAWGMSWLVIGFLPLPVACLYKPSIGFMIEPHWFFVSSLGMFVLVSSIVLAVISRYRMVVPCILLAVIFSLMVYQARYLNDLWDDEVRYCRYWLNVAPGFKNVMFYLSNAYVEKGQKEKAREYFHKALANVQDDWQIYNNLGLMDMEEGKLEEAAKNFDRAIRIFPRSSIVHSNLGLVWLKRNNIPIAEYYFQKAMDDNMFALEPALNLADIYKKQGNNAGALNLYRRNIAIDPNHKETLINLMDLYFVQGEKGQALVLGKKILSGSRDLNFLLDAGKVFAQHHYSSMAFVFFTTALKLDPNFKEGYLELGKWYGNKEEYNRAIAAWHEGLALDPKDQRFIELINEAKRLQQAKALLQK